MNPVRMKNEEMSKKVGQQQVCRWTARGEGMINLWFPVQSLSKAKRKKYFSIVLLRSA